MKAFNLLALAIFAVLSASALLYALETRVTHTAYCVTGAGLTALLAVIVNAIGESFKPRYYTSKDA